MLSPTEAMLLLRKETPRLEAWDAVKIFLDWRFHSCYSGCVVCKRDLSYNGVCFYERLESGFDVGEDGARDWGAFGASEECARGYGASVCGRAARAFGCAEGVGDAGWEALDQLFT